jgi:hypothetical protein
MFLAHSFRLRDPWQCEALAQGGVLWTRAFHRPTGLEEDDALWLVCSGLPTEATVTVNGQPVPRTAAGRNEFDVTDLLAETNRIEIAISSDLAPSASRLAPSAFPFDVRLGVVGRS